MIAFSPKKRPGLTAGKALQQELFIAIDERTGFISEVRVVLNTGPKQQRVTQTQFINWSQQGDQLVPGPAGFSAGVNLVYNSSIFDTKTEVPTTNTSVLQMSYTPSAHGGGWHYSYKYTLWSQSTGDETHYAEYRS